MNRTGIEWTDFTWNPVTGCYHGCDYCYARKIAHRFKDENSCGSSLEFRDLRNPGDQYLYMVNSGVFPHEFRPTFYQDRLKEPVNRKKPAKIFVSSMGDLFGDWVPKEWIDQVIDVASKCPQHTFQFLTKNPARYYNFDFPDNCWLGASADNANHAHCRSEILYNLNSDNVKYLSLEPLLQSVSDYIDYEGLDWIIIGAQTGPGAKETKSLWVKEVLKDYKGPVFLKDNLDWNENIQEYPKGADE